MNLLGWSWHVVGLLAPALFVGAVLALLALPLEKTRPSARALLRRAAVNFVVGAGVLLAGLALTGHDGRMVTYAVLVLVCAAVQAWQMRR